MQRMIKKIMCGLVLCSASTGSMAYITDEIKLEVKVNLLRPVCVLKSITDNGKVDFGDFYALDVVTGGVSEKDITFDFKECNNLSNLRISFTPAGNIPRNTGDYIPNQLGDDKARGIGVSLFRNKAGNSWELIPLNKDLVVSTSELTGGTTSNSGTDYQWKMRAKVVSTYSDTAELITPGKLDAQVSMMITYE